MILRNVIASIALIIALLPYSSVASERGTREEAVAMVERAVEQYRDEGLDALIASINAQEPRYRDRDLYVFLNSQRGAVVAHSAEPTLVGADLWWAQDSDGLLLIQELADVAAKGEPAWVDYKWPDPNTKKIRQKSSYTVLLDQDHHLGVGVYID